MKTLTVMARPGVRVPKQWGAGGYIQGRRRIRVPDCAYYRRRIAEGDLILTNITTSKEAGSGQSACEL
ncbi:MAG: DUF2635 domain-containing protein [Desulfovibrio sp.]|jgi:hypothetical protein|nr:DUF2635 domain-containing protein [Desulfovibrio sp.]